MIVLDLLWDFFKDNPKYLWTNIFFSLSLPVLDIIVPNLYGKMFESTGKNILKTMITITLVMILFEILTQLSILNSDIQYFKLNNKITQVIINNVFETNKSSNNGDIYVSDLLFNIHRIQDMIRDWFYEVRLFVVPYVMFFILSCIYFFFIHPYLGLTMLILLIANLYLFAGSASKCEQQTVALNKSMENVLNQIEDTLSNLQSVQTNNKEKDEFNRIKDASNEYENKSYDIIKCSLNFKIIGTILLFSFLFIMTYLSYNLLNTGVIKMTQLVTVFFIIKHNLSSNQHIIKLIGDIAYDYGVYVELIHMLEIRKDKVEPKIIKYDEIDIKLKDIWFKYPQNDRYILQGINLHVKKGDRIAIIGDIGCGKSTITKLIMKILKFDKGQILFNDTPFEKIKNLDLYYNVGFMPQVPVLFNRSILDNIRYGREHMTEEEVIALLNKFGLFETFSHLEKGIHTPVGKNGGKLSGGQRQIIWFLRVLLKNPPLLILDEPTASLDAETKKVMSQLIETVMKDKTIIMVTHDDFLMKFANKKIEIGNGRIIGNYDTDSAGSDGLNNVASYNLL